MTTIALPRGGAADVEVHPGHGVLRVSMISTRQTSPAEGKLVRAQVAEMFRLDEDLTPLYSRLRGDRARSWVKRKGAGRIFRAPTVFEDLVKLLLTTNCSWAATRGMVARLVEALGEEGPSGRRAFPRASAMAQRDAGFYREVVRAGYRAEALAALYQSVDSGQLGSDGWRHSPQIAEYLREQVLALRGFGPYAAGHVLRLLGHHQDLCLDSWVRAKLARINGRRKPLSDRAITRKYAEYGLWAGLVLWLDITRDWHTHGGEAADS